MIEVLNCDVNVITYILVIYAIYADKWVNFSILKTQINSKKHPRDIVEEQQSENWNIML